LNYISSPILLKKRRLTGGQIGNPCKRSGQDTRALHGDYERRSLSPLMQGARLLKGVKIKAKGTGQETFSAPASQNERASIEHGIKEKGIRNHRENQRRGSV